ncbi:MAG: hypothetical protein AAFV59_03565 [Pseudomonadota bacterium]
MTKRNIGPALLLAIIVHATGTLLWAGAAAERIDTLERQMAETRPVTERLARLEARLDAVQAQLNRIEDKVDQL